MFGRMTREGKAVKHVVKEGRLSCAWVMILGWEDAPEGVEGGYDGIYKHMETTRGQSHSS